MKKNIVWFEEVGKNDVGLVGGKGANLGEMTTAKLPIPYGFVVTSQAYFNFIKANKLQRQIHSFLTSVNVNNPTELHQASKHAQDIIMKATMQDSLVNEIIRYYDQLTAKEAAYFKKDNQVYKKAIRRLKHLYSPPLVAVRSSATAEDLPTASFAGQQETYLNIKGEAHLLEYVKRCWASLFTERAIYYRHEQGFDHFKIGLAAVVQRMVQSDKSGIAFSIDPVSNDKTKIVIEAIYGLGEYIVQGKVTPDHYEVDKKSFVILAKELKYQNVKYVKKGIENIEVKLNKEIGLSQKLTEKEIIEVALLVKQIEDHYYFPQDIEWAIEGDSVFIVQSRPITTTANVSAEVTSLKGAVPFLTGAPASPGIGIGPVKIIRSPKEIDKVKKGDVLVAPQTNPDYVPAMKKAIAIITEKGGRTSHAAIVSRELGIPAVVGAEGATTKLKNDMIVSVNGKTGEIYKGSVLSEAKKIEAGETKKVHKVHYKTLTKVYVNLAEPELASEVAKLDCDGIGLLRAEFMIANIGTHPKEFIKRHEEHLYVRRLMSDLLKFVKPFSPRPIVYRATDFKTNEYRHLKGGAAYEPFEENPMIGFRGASRYIADPSEFMLELLAIRKIWEMGYTNLHLMIPFVRVPWEIIRIKEMVQKSGLLSFPQFKLLIMVEVPYCALNLEEFLKVGIHGVSIGTNDLTMMLLGVDRDNQEVANIYDERNPMVEQVLEYIVKTAGKFGVTSSICGQAASDYPDIVERLVKAGITSVSVNPDAVDRTRELIYNIEKKYLQSLKK
ncbi:phosphoenolpyruvate synthase [Candidatus Roizmanbacteria bacterium CG_4_10_14_0_8_um_filter_39_9]|uniref:Phosphoenolpyruvate synthase n=1 Tax=Candidatus Roizmanbacteria bacterium CG_4_10_14_0_8_um_filter_39_9 TaxID=1974829 RepID=A0A2M7QDB9_9BACT|nr:MAG: phosphoenolpyruvate synthase [Candidatus Roizmanbacteria bacterium CG_4_10_14_0_8_um_filter_39_9]